MFDIDFGTNVPQLLLDGWSERIKLYPGITKLSSSMGTVESRYVSERQKYQICEPIYMPSKEIIWHSHGPICC